MKRARTPMILQMEATGCGAASLAIVLATHGLWVPLGQLRDDCGVSRDGSKASNVVKAARRYGLEARGLRCNIDNLRELEPPFVVFWKFNHFLVVEGLDAERVWLNDPAFGHRVVTLDSFDRDFTGVTLVMSPTAAFRKGGRPPGVVAGLRRRLRGSRGALAFVALTAALLVLPGLAVPVFTQVFVDHVLVERGPTWVRPLLAATALALGLQLAALTVQRRAVRRLKTRLSVNLASGFVAHLLSLPTAFFAQRYPGELADRVTLNDGVAERSGDLALAAIDAAMLVLYAAVMVWFDPCLTAVTVAIGAGGLWALRVAGRRQAEARARMLHSRGRATGVAVQGLLDIESIKATATEGDLYDDWAGQHALGVNTRQELGLAALVVAMLPAIGAASIQSLVLVVGGWRVMDGGLSLGVLLAFQALVLAFLAPLERLMSLAGDIQALQGDLARLDDVLGHPPDEGASAPVGIPEPIRGHLAAVDLSFGYARIGEPLFAGFSVEVPPGRWVALVGGSGSGKSTLLRILAGLYLPWTGAVTLDGRPREEHSRSTLSEHTAFVDQDITLFEGTVRDNLTLWDDTLPDEPLWQALEDAALRDEIAGLPGGLDGVLEEGGRNLSGGQRQRLELARALVRDPSLLLLDEATSALDAATEQRVLERIRARGCAVVLVAHRLSTVRDCDEIVVLGDGGVAERGTHAALWRAEGAYAQLLRAGGEGLA